MGFLDLTDDMLVRVMHCYVEAHGNCDAQRRSGALALICKPLQALVQTHLVPDLRCEALCALSGAAAQMQQRSTARQFLRELFAASSNSPTFPRGRPFVGRCCNVCCTVGCKDCLYEQPIFAPGGVRPIFAPGGIEMID